MKHAIGHLRKEEHTSCCVRCYGNHRSITHIKHNSKSMATLMIGFQTEICNTSVFVLFFVIVCVCVCVCVCVLE